MKTKKPILRLAALAALSFFTGNEIVAQTNIGAACGCPSYASRQEVSITLAPGSFWVTLPAGAYGKELLGNQNVVLTCNKTWLLNEKLYIGPGSTLTIEPGTVIKGGVAGSPAAATALIIERGGKIIAPGVEDCPIVFTAAADGLNGAYPVNNKGMWGGVLICGKASNNLTLALNGPFVPGAQGKLAAADGLGVLEGFASSYPQDQFGATIGSAPYGYVSAISPTGSYSFSSGSVTASQNASGQTALVTTGTIPSHMLTYVAGKAISGTGIALGGTSVANAATTTMTLSANSTANLSGTYTIGATQSAAALTGNAVGTTLTLTAANPLIANGMIVSGTGIPASTTVSSISGADITLSVSSMVAMTGTYTFSTPGASSAGSGSTGTALTLSGTTTGTIVAGMSVSGTGIASGTTVVSITGTAVTLSTASTAAMSGTYTFGNPTFTAADVLNFTGSTKVKIPAALPLLVAGVVVTGTGIPANTTVVSISGTTLTLTAAATAQVTGALNFAQQYPNPGATAFFPISGAKSAGSGTSGSTSLTLSGTTFGTIVAGMPVSGTGIAAGTTVSSISTTGSPAVTTVTLSAVSTAAMTGEYYFTGTTTAPAGLAVNGTEYVNFAGVSISAAGEQFNDDDNSGIMSYVSIRHSGANLLVGSEINGLTLASVGRGTKIDHIEIVSCADDNIEIFGGTVDLKYCTTLYGNDDMYDYDLGWTGKAQFLFGMKADHNGTPHVSQDNDNGFECDGGDNNQLLTPSNPTIYNATILGNAKTTGTADNRAVAAMNFKEAARGTLNNSVFAHFQNGLNVESAAVGTNNNNHNAFHNWTVAGTQSASPLSLKVKCNTFIGVVNPMVQSASSLAAVGTVTGPNTTQFTADGNLTLTQALGETAGFKYAFAINGSTNAITTKNDVVPSTGVAAFQLGTGCAQAPMDGFFSPANYRGAFAPSANNENWLSDWTYSQVLNSTNGVTACPTDINNDGTTDVNDFLIFSGQFGQACN